MTKREFLKKLREYLSYELPESLVEQNETYYRDYIDHEVRSGKSEAEVISDLGDPQLIARSVIDAARSGSDGIPGTADDKDFYGEIYGGSDNPDKGPSGESNYGGRGTGTSFPGGGFYVTGGGCLLPVIIFILIFFFFSMMGSVLAILSPVLTPICIVFLILWLLNRRR